jgi:nicotinate-nucleotide--dimethylbenzimidazole phosphoribosyltransferase
MTSLVAAKPFTSGPAFERYGRLTMPPGALHRLFEPALRILAQRDHSPQTPFSIHFASAVFAGDHGVAHSHPVSAFPQVVTGQMVANFVAGGAAMSVLSRHRGAHLCVVDVGVARSFPYALPASTASGVTFLSRNIPQAIRSERYDHGTADFTEQSAMSQKAFDAAFAAGAEAIDTLLHKGPCHAVMLGEMGIGNTTAATAVIAHTIGRDPREITGAGTGITDASRSKKAEVIAMAIERHKRELGASANNPSDIVRSLGGFELAAIAGAAHRAAEMKIHVLLDGVIATASLLPYLSANPALASWIIPCHMGAEPAHRAALQSIDAKPLLELDLRLGEGSGAALAAALISDAVAMLNEMATFESAAVSDSH